MERRPWLPHEIEAVRRLYATSKTADLAVALCRTVTMVYRMAEKLGLRKTDEYLASPASGRLDGTTGMSGRFQRGAESWNRGMKGWSAPGTERTRFKKGQKSGRAAMLEQPIGAERISKDGIRQRKVNNDMPLQRRWKAVHAIVWEEANGPIPSGHVVVFCDGNRTNIVLGNLELISRADLARRNHPRNKSPELAKLVQLKGAITRQVNRIAREAKESQE